MRASKKRREYERLRSEWRSKKQYYEELIKTVPVTSPVAVKVLSELKKAQTDMLKYA